MVDQRHPIAYRHPTADRDDCPTQTPRQDNVDSIEPWRLFILLTSVSIGIFLSLMDGTVVATALIDISKDLGGFQQTQWIALAYVLLEIGLCATLARLSDAVGRRAVICGCFAVFLCASMACGASRTLKELIGFRALQGTAGGGLFGTGVTVFLEWMGFRRLIHSSVVLGSIIAAAGVVGPTVGGLLARYASWRYIFWINGPLTVIPGLLLFFLWPKGKQDYKGSGTKLKHIDYLGAFLIVVAPALTIFIINEAAIGEYGWSSPVTIIILITSLLLWICFFLWQRELTRRPRLANILPQLPWEILVNRVLVAALIHAILSSATLYTACYHIPIRAQIVNLSDPIFAGILLLPMLVGVAIGAAMAGLLSVKKNLTFATMAVSSLLQVIACVLLSYLPSTVEIATRQWIYGAVLGLGTGTSVGTSTLLSVLHTNTSHLAVMQGIMGQMRVFGGSIGIAVSFTIMHTCVTSRLQGPLSPDQLDNFNRSPLAAITVLSPTQLLQAREAYIFAFDAVMRACIGLSALSCVVSLFIFASNPPTVAKKVQEIINWKEG